MTRPEPRLSLRDFARAYLLAEKQQAVFVPLKPANELHEYLATELNELRHRRGWKLGVLAPRGSAKTTWTTFAFPLCAAVQRWVPYIVLLADTGKQARAYLRDLRRQLETNEKLARDYPSACGRGLIWTSDLLKLRNGVQIAAYGTGGHIRGTKSGESRPSLVVIDDPQSKEDITSELLRERAWEWLVRDVLPAGSPDTNFVAAGTALHREAIMCKLQSTPGWEMRVFKSIIQWPEQMDLWDAWQEILQNDDDDDREAKARAFYKANQEATHE